MTCSPLLTVVAALFVSAAVALAEPSSPPPLSAPTAILLRVEQKNTSDMNAKERGHEGTETRSLKIFVTNSSPNPADLKAKYTYFGRDMVSHSVVVVSSGEQAVSVKPQGETMAELPPSKSTWVMEHFQGGARGRPAAKVPASGAKFMQVYSGSDKVAEAYEPPSVKDEVGKAQPVTAAKK